MRSFVFSLIFPLLVLGCGGAVSRPSNPLTSAVTYFNPPGIAPRTHEEERLYGEFFDSAVRALEGAKSNREKGLAALFSATDRLINRLEALPTVGGWKDSRETRILLRVILSRRDLGESARRLNCIYKDQVRWPAVEGNTGDSFPLHLACQ